MNIESFMQELETWLDTPFHHQGRCKGIGVDCIGLIVKAAEAQGVKLPDETGYKRFEHGDKLVEKINLVANLVESEDDLQIGDVIFYRWSCDATPQRTNHLAVYCGDGLIIHADGSPVVKRVTKARVHFQPEAFIRGIYRFKEEI